MGCCGREGEHEPWLKYIVDDLGVCIMDFSYAFLSSGKICPQVQQYFLNHVFTWAIAAQLAAGGFAFLLAYMAAEALRSWIGRLMV
jgi:hypothetical protein